MAYELTRKGDLEADNALRRPGPESSVIGFLDLLNHRPASLEEICDETRMDSSKAVKVLNRLIEASIVEEV